MNNQEYHRIKRYSYQEYCDYLKDKYGGVFGEYMTEYGVRAWDRAKGKDGLVIHHIYEDRAPGLCCDDAWLKYPHEWQCGENLVYCDYLEHLLLHIMICEHPAGDDVGYKGVINRIVPELNGWYSGEIPTDKRMKGCYKKVEGDSDVYLDLIHRFIINRRQCDPSFDAVCLCRGVKNTNGRKPLIYRRIEAKERNVLDNERAHLISMGIQPIEPSPEWLTIAVDFDNTLFKTQYPVIISPNTEVIEGVKRLKDMGNKIILNTCRKDQYLADAVKACADEGLVFDAVNENLQERIDRYGGDCRKISADFYIEDRVISPGDLGFFLETVNNLQTKEAIKNEE